MTQGGVAAIAATKEIATNKTLFTINELKIRGSFSIQKWDDPVGSCKWIADVPNQDTVRKRLAGEKKRPRGSSACIIAESIDPLFPKRFIAFRNNLLTRYPNILQ